MVLELTLGWGHNGIQKWGVNGAPDRY